MLTARFESKSPHKTLFVVIEGTTHDSLEEAKLTFEVLYGWQVDLRKLDNTLLAHKSGTGLFGGWSPEEFIVYKSQARRALAMLGIKKVPHKKLTLHDLL